MLNIYGALARFSLLDGQRRGSLWQMVTAATAEPPQRRKFTPSQARIASAKGVAVRRARQLLVKEVTQPDTVSREAREKLGVMCKWILRRVKVSKITIGNIAELQKLTDVMNLAFAWSAKDSPQNHLHLHDVGKLLAEREQTVSKPAQSVETPEIAANDGEWPTHPPEK